MSARIEKIELVEVRLDGTPAKDLDVLSAAATEACAATAAHYKRAGFSPPWISYLALADRAIVGICAFTAAPKSGRVEIAYHSFPSFEGRGVATAMARELVALARSRAPEIEIFAQTSAEENASTAVLRKLGFQFAGAVDHAEEGSVWEWRVKG
jgi:ribosomal-protein-alanine N-acetyltransferase